MSQIEMLCQVPSRNHHPPESWFGFGSEDIFEYDYPESSVHFQGVSILDGVGIVLQGYLWSMMTTTS